MKNLYHRVRNKISREYRKKSWRSVPFQEGTTFRESGSLWYEPLLTGASTFLEVCTGSETAARVLEILERVTPDSYVEFNRQFYRTGLERFGKQWCYADINTALYGIASLVSVKNYLEIGVRRGRSMAMMASARPDVNVVGFDMWIHNYVGIENPGPDFVKEEMRRLGHRGSLELVSGNSHQTVPEYFRKNPEAYFDVITVDGDHTEKGAADDLRTVVPRLKIGGILVFDDISNPEHRYLKKVWHKVVAGTGRFSTLEYDETGYGVAVGIRRY